MGCGCGGRKTNATGMRVAGNRGTSAPRSGHIVTPRTMPPTMIRAAAQLKNQETPAFSMQRREVERKRRLAILKAQGK